MPQEISYVPYCLPSLHYGVAVQFPLGHQDHSAQSLPSLHDGSAVEEQKVAKWQS